MFLLDYFYGTKSKTSSSPPPQLQTEEDWVLVDNNELTLTTSLDDYGILEEDELAASQLDPEPQPKQSAINTSLPLSPTESEELQSNVVEEVVPVQEEEIRVQNPTGGQLKPKVPSNNLTAASLGLVKAESTKFKNNCKKQAQRRSDKYKSGLWSGRSNDRKCGKCY